MDEKCTQLNMIRPILDSKTFIARYQTWLITTDADQENEAKYTLHYGWRLKHKFIEEHCSHKS